MGVLQVLFLLSTISSLSCSFMPMHRPRARPDASHLNTPIRPDPSPQNHRACSRLCAMKVTIRVVGKKTGGEKWLDQACSMYQSRLRPAGMDLETEFHKSNDALIKGLRGDYDKGNTVVLLDPKGKKYTSEDLAEHIYMWIERGGSRLVFAIGGAEGLPEEVRRPQIGQPVLLSLSDLTFTHQFARLVLIEQLYRASEIRKGSAYHK